MKGRPAAPPRTAPPTARQPGAPVARQPEPPAERQPEQPSAKQPEAPAARQPEQLAANQSDPQSLIPDDVSFGNEQLPDDFWDTPATQPEKPEPAGRAAAPAAATPDHASAQDQQPPSDIEQAFDQLQSLFPGRVVEVRPVEAEDASPGATIEPLDDEAAAVDGYDDDQDSLPFGPGST